MRVLVVVKAHPYEGKQREVGTEYPATDSDAHLLVLSGQARYKDNPQSYDTRDLAAKQPSTSRRARRLNA